MNNDMDMLHVRRALEELTVVHARLSRVLRPDRDLDHWLTFHFLEMSRMQLELIISRGQSAERATAR